MHGASASGGRVTMVIALTISTSVVRVVVIETLSTARPLTSPDVGGRLSSAIGVELDSRDSKASGLASGVLLWLNSQLLVVIIPLDGSGQR